MNILKKLIIKAKHMVKKPTAEEIEAEKAAKAAEKAEKEAAKAAEKEAKEAEKAAIAAEKEAEKNKIDPTEYQLVNKNSGDICEVIAINRVENHSVVPSEAHYDVITPAFGVRFEIAEDEELVSDTWDLVKINE